MHAAALAVSGFSRTTAIVRCLAAFVRLAVLAMLLSAGVQPLMAQQQPPRSPAQEGFVPVDKLPTAQEQLPAAPLVMVAYAVAWIAVFGYLVSIWLRLGRVEREIQTLSRRVEAGSRR